MLIKWNIRKEKRQKGLYGMEDHHHMTGTPGIYTSGRSTSSSSSPGVAGSSPALLVVPQPINATKMGGMQNGGPQPRKYQCKMCPQKVVEICSIEFEPQLRKIK
ncbi:unnamed protein product [Diabrotica balteata]|uniref:Uncharacterized protein n=1 Tax=Diabrotica balteata TaxID=107213 RepID=A0A9N9SVR0_DIABA|nr:unnamed protein product [Diabrotica balteata]